MVDGPGHRRSRPQRVAYLVERHGFEVDKAAAVTVHARLRLVDVDTAVLGVESVGENVEASCRSPRS